MEELIDLEAAARALGIRTITVYKWVAERKIPFLKVGGALRFRPSGLDPTEPQILPERNRDWAFYQTFQWRMGERKHRAMFSPRREL